MNKRGKEYTWVMNRFTSRKTNVSKQSQNNRMHVLEWNKSFKLTMGLKLSIVVVLISTLILFVHIWYIIIISERKVHLGMRFAHRQLGLGLSGHSGWGGDEVINSFVNRDGNQSTCPDTGLCWGWEITV